MSSSCVNLQPHSSVLLPTTKGLTEYASSFYPWRKERISSKKRTFSYQIFYMWSTFVFSKLWCLMKHEIKLRMYLYTSRYTTQTVMCTNLQSHTDVLPARRGLMLGSVFMGFLFTKWLSKYVLGTWREKTNICYFKTKWRILFRKNDLVNMWKWAFALKYFMRN